MSDYNTSQRTAYLAGQKAERQRLIKLLSNFWCGEPECSKHPVRMDWVIAAISNEDNK